MAKYFKILTAVILIMLAGCTKDFLDINEDPNYPTTAPLGLLLTNVEVDLAEAFSIRYGISNFVSVYMHQVTVREDPDQYGVSGTSFYTNNQWDAIYTGPLQDLELMIGTAGDNKIYAGIAKILKAYSYSILVDIYGDVPFTQANKQTEKNPYPEYDQGATIYPALFTLIDEGIADLSNSDAKNTFVPGSNDLIYGGDIDKWTRLANTIKLKLYTQIRLVDDVSTEVTALLANNGENLIGEGESFELLYGTKKSPDNRNPGSLEYEAGQKGYYISPWFYRLMRGQNPNLFTGNSDPRIRYYFYRQLKSGQATREGNPTEYRDGGFVSIYFGSIGPDRDHSTDGSMTLLGMYPVGGRYDQGDALSVSDLPDDFTGDAFTGAAPYRFLTYADRLYLEAELAITGVTSGNARDLLEDAMVESFDQVDRVVASAKGSQVVPRLDTATVAADYRTNILDEYDATASNSEKLEIIMTQKWIQSFGSNHDQWTDYRRTGYPLIFDPRNPLQAPGGFVQTPIGNPIPVQLINDPPLSLPWGQDDLSLNPNAPEQKNPATFKVFWDN